MEKNGSSKKKIIIIVASAICAAAVLATLLCVFLIVVPKEKEKKEWERLVTEYRESRRKEFEEENALYDDYEVDVAFLGDSLTAGCDVKKYYPEYVVTNRGVGGDTTFDLEERMSVSAYELKPKVVVMLIGGNNLKNMFDNYEDLLKGLKENLPETKVIIVSLTAMGKTWAEKNQIAALNNVKIKLLAEKYGFDFVDVFTSLYDVETGEIFEEYTSDGAHLTASGYEVLTGLINSAIEKALGK